MARLTLSAAILAVAAFANASSASANIAAATHAAVHAAVTDSRDAASRLIQACSPDGGICVRQIVR